MKLFGIILANLRKKYIFSKIEIFEKIPKKPLTRVKKLRLAEV